MSLMSRIKVRHFLQFTPLEQLEFIRSVQAKRSDALTKSRLAPKRAVHLKGKSSPRRSGKDPIKEAAKLLGKLSPEQLAAIKESYGMKE